MLINFVVMALVFYCGYRLGVVNAWRVLSDKDRKPTNLGREGHSGPRPLP